MKIIIFGADGFIGRNVFSLLSKNHEVIKAVRNIDRLSDNSIAVDLSSADSVFKVIDEIKPEVIINCAGVVGGGANTDLNFIFTKNILEQSSRVGGVKKVIISGSAGEYGQVDSLPVSEDFPLMATSEYGLSKIKEEEFAINYGSSNDINTVVLRIFNPVGAGMADKFLLTNLIKQVRSIKSGELNNISVSRLDSRRDYVSVVDIAEAYKVVVEGNNRYNIYNIGSGKSTSNQELLDLVIKNSNLIAAPGIQETSNIPEPLMAIQADISRISSEFNWSPRQNIGILIAEACNL